MSWSWFTNHFSNIWHLTVPSVDLISVYFVVHALSFDFSFVNARLDLLFNLYDLNTTLLIAALVICPSFTGFLWFDLSMSRIELSQIQPITLELQYLFVVGLLFCGLSVGWVALVLHDNAIYYQWCIAKILTTRSLYLQKHNTVNWCTQTVYNM